MNQQSQKEERSHIGVYAWILNEKQECLVIKKNRGPYTGLFDLPGGSAEFHERFEQTLEREVFEETGQVITKSQQLTTLLALFETPQLILRHIGIIYAASLKPGEPLKTISDDQDSAGAIWIHLSELCPSCAVPFLISLKDEYSQAILI